MVCHCKAEKTMIKTLFFIPLQVSLYEKHNRPLVPLHIASWGEVALKSKLLERDIIQEETKADMLGYMPMSKIQQFQCS